MKKFLLLLLLFPLFSFGQNVQVFLKYYNHETGQEVSEFSPIEEGQTLRTEVHLVTVGSDDYAAMDDTKYLFLDLQYNHDILSPTTTGYAFPGIDAISDPGAITERYDFPNVSFGAFESNLLKAHNDWQTGNTVYTTNAKWSVIRIAIQLSTKTFQDVIDASTLETSLPIFDFTSAVKPGAASDPENADTRINLGVIHDSTGTEVTSFVPSNGNKQPYSVMEAVTYSAKLHFDLPETLDPTNFQVNVANGSMGIQEMPTTYTLDANADVVINNVELDSVYSLFTLQPIDASYIPDVHTVTDAYRAFKFLTDVGINGGDYIYNGFEGFSADVNLDGTLNSADTYGLLAYVMGVDVNDNVQGEMGYCLPEQNEDGTWFHGCTATVRIEDYNEDVLGQSVSLNNSEGGTGGGWSSEFTPTEDGQTFTFGYWHHGDLDQSHSTAYPAEVSVTAKSFNISLSSKPVGTVNFDMVSKIENGQVIVELNHSGEPIVGMQARIKYDTDRLILKDVVYDTGNTTTNFSKELNKGLLFGTLSVNGSVNIKEGTPFKLIFDTVGKVNNTTGLFYFENTDAVKANGDKMNLNIQ